GRCPRYRRTCGSPPDSTEAASAACACRHRGHRKRARRAPASMAMPVPPCRATPDGSVRRPGRQSSKPYAKITSDSTEVSTSTKMSDTLLVSSGSTLLAADSHAIDRPEAFTPSEVPAELLPGWPPVVALIISGAPAPGTNRNTCGYAPPP